MYSDLFYGKIVYAPKTSLYLDEETEVNTQIATGLSDKKGYFYTFNDVLYYKNGVTSKP